MYTGGVLRGVIFNCKGVEPYVHGHEILGGPNFGKGDGGSFKVCF